MSFLSSKINLEKVAALIGTFYLFLSIYPLPMWLIPNPPVYAIFFVCLLFLSILLYSKGLIKISLHNLSLFFLLLLFVLYITLPISEPIINFGLAFKFSCFFLIILFNNTIHFNIYAYFKKIIIFFSFVSVVVFVFTLLGFNLPHFKLEGFSSPMVSQNAYYKVYFIVVSSTNTIYEIMGLTIARACGPFLEPGHFGIYLGITIALEKIIQKKISIILIIAGIITFSPAFIIIFSTIIFYDIFFNRRIKLLIIISVSLFLTFTLIIQNPILKDALYFLAIGRNYRNIEEVSLDARTGDNAVLAYNNFKKSNRFLIGKGQKWVDENHNILSDYRGFIFRYGLFGITLSILLIFMILAKSRTNLIIILAIISILILAHRFWMFTGPYLYLLMLSGTRSLEFIKRKTDESTHHQ